MDVSTRKLNQYTSELNWIITELNCVYPALNKHGPASASVHECIERLQYLYDNIAKTAKKGTKNAKRV